MNNGSSFPGSRNGCSRWTPHSNAPVLVLFKTATCIISSHWLQMRLNEMHLGLRQLALVHSTLLSNIPAPGSDSCKAEAPQGGYECSCGRLTPARNPSPWLQRSVTAPCCCRLLSSVFQAQMESAWPNHRQTGGRARNGKKEQRQHTEILLTLMNRSRFCWLKPANPSLISFSPSLKSSAPCCQEEPPLYTR